MYAAPMNRLSCALVCFGLLCTCGGGGGSKSKDWSGAPMTERAVDYCVKLAACTDEAEGTIGACVETMADLQVFSGQVPTRRALSDLVVLRDCYNKARSCADVRRCAGVPDSDELEPCDLELSARSCREHMGTSVLRTCLPAPEAEGGVWVEVDCTKYGRVCGFDEENQNRCVNETCVPGNTPPSCDEATGDIRVCGGVDPVSGMPVGSLFNEYACGALGLGCEADLGDPEDPADDQLVCVGEGESCDPAAEAPACDGTTLTACLPNLDGTGNRGSWDCATGAIHHVCDAENFRCAVSGATCDPAAHPGACDGNELSLCVDGELVTTDCAEHGLGDCQPDAEGHGRCVD